MEVPIAMHDHSSEPTDDYRWGYQSGIEAAQTAALKAATALWVETAEPLWRIGDGMGGWALSLIWSAAEHAGLDLGMDRHFEPTSRVVKLAERDGWRCHYCGHPLGIGHPDVVRRPHVEHVMPKSRGGSNRLADLVLACPPCNTAKAARTPVEWLGRPCCDRHAF